METIKEQYQWANKFGAIGEMKVRGVTRGGRIYNNHFYFQGKISQPPQKIPLNETVKYTTQSPGHQQTPVTVDGITVEVDSNIAEHVRKLLAAGFRTDVSCEGTGPSKNKYRSYINPCCHCPSGPCGFEHLKVGTPREMAECLGLKKGEWRGYNGVLWFNY
jgi:hypothetical protein